jgi:hypothetical protein
MLAIEGAVWGSYTEQRGTIYNKSAQILAHANDTEIIGRRERAVREAFENVERTVREMELWANEVKTQYIDVTFDWNQLQKLLSNL